MSNSDITQTKKQLERICHLHLYQAPRYQFLAIGIMAQTDKVPSSCHRAIVSDALVLLFPVQMRYALYRFNKPVNTPNYITKDVDHGYQSLNKAYAA
jgi:hypothetical protein